jgi:hypothetical protein
MRGARGGAVGWSTALQAVWSRLPDCVTGIFHSFHPHYGPGVDSASNRNEYQEYFLGVKRPVRTADNITTFICQLSINLGTSISWNPKGLSRPVMGLLFIIG